MSNKTQLSNNNTQLASLIQELQGKATGGGGASVEMCTVSLEIDGPYDSGNDVMYYTNQNREVVNGTWSSLLNTPITVTKGSLLILYGLMATQFDLGGNGTEEVNEFLGNDIFVIFMINGDCTIVANM